jgi:predicted MFS family arabinose efflux permease
MLWLKNDNGAYRDPIDIPGLLLVTGGLFSLVFGLSHAETTSWSDTYTIGFLVLGVVLLVAFALLESRVGFPLLPPRIVRNRTRGGSMLAMLFASAGLFGIFLFLTYYLQEILAFSPIKTGFAFLPLVAGLVVVSQVSNRVLLPRFGPKPVVPTGLLLAAVAMLLLHGVGLQNSYIGRVLPSLLLLGIGLGLGLAPAFSTATLGLDPSDAGVGSAALNTTQQVGGSIGVALLNTLAASSATAYLVSHGPGPLTLRASALHGYTTAFLWSSLFFVAGAAIAGLVLQRGNMQSLTKTKPDGASQREMKATADLRTTCWHCGVAESDTRVGATGSS